MRPTLYGPSAPNQTEVTIYCIAPKGESDPHSAVAAGRCPFTTEGLLAVADLIDRFRARRDGDGM